MNDTEKAEIVELLFEMVIDLLPDVMMREMYGGTVIELEENKPLSRIGGIYVYANYVTLEFAKGASFNDPTGILQGQGKFRRHIKIHNKADIEAKLCKDFLQKAILYFNR